MGHKGSFSGGGGAAGEDLRDGLDEWLDSLPGEANTPSPDADDGDTIQETTPSTKPPPSSPAERILPTTALFRSTRGGSRSGKTPDSSREAALTRTASASARSAGRGAAAAYAYRAGDAQTLHDLGLDFDALRANPNIFDVAHQIAQKVCEDLPAGTIETSEQLHVVANLAEWLMESDDAGLEVSLGQIAEEAVALILAEAYLVATASQLNTKDMTGAARAEFEDSVRQAAEELAAYANLSPSGPSAEEFTKAIEDGMEYLRSVYEQ